MLVVRRTASADSPRACGVTLALCLAACQPSAAPAPPSGFSFALSANPQTLVLRPGERQTIRFELRDTRGAAIAGALVRFALAGELPELARGASVNASELLTDAQGATRLELRAGLPGRFQLRASASGAVPLEVAVFVSASSHADLHVVPALDPVPSGATLTVLVADNDRCARFAPLDPTRPPTTTRPPQTADPALGTTFRSLRTDQSHAVLGLARTASTRVVAMGCLDVPGSQLLDGATARIHLPLAMVPPRLEGRYAVVSDLRAPLLPPQLTEQRAAWTELAACPLGVAQRWLDCALDALSDGDADPLDCSSPAGEAGAAFAALAARRGSPGADDCRPPLDGLGRPSLDALVTERLARGPAGVLAGLPALARRAEALWRPWRLEGTLVLTRDDSGRWLAHHTLTTLAFDDGGGPTAPVTLFDLALPALEARFVPVAGNARELALGAHGFTLRPGTAARLDFLRRVLRPSGLADDVPGLVAAIARDLRADDADPPSEGCAALDAIACPAAGLPTRCLTDACARATAAWSARLEGGFDLFDGEDRDLLLDGSAPLLDLDDNGVIDRLGADPEAAGTPELGLWSGTLRTRAGSFPITGTWSAVRVAP